MEHKTAEFKLDGEPAEDGTFEGYASVFGVVDDGQDVVQPGAFTKSLAGGRKVKMLWQHNIRDVIGKWDHITEDSHGLYVKGRLLTEIEKGREALTLMRAGVIDSMSIGFITKEADYQRENSIRNLKEVDLYEVSLVTFPMNTAATVTSVKSMTTIRELEGFLRDAGLSKSEALAVASHGFKGLSGLRDAAGDAADTDEGLRSLLEEIGQLKRSISHV